MTAGAAGLFRQLEQWFLDSWATIKMGFMQDLLGLYNMNLLICRNEYYFFPTNFEWNSRWLIWDSKKKMLKIQPIQQLFLKSDLYYFHSAAFCLLVNRWSCN